MEPWKEYRYTELVTLIGGGTPSTKEASYWGGDIPWLSVKDFCGASKFVSSAEKSITQLGLNNSSTKLLEQGDIIISARGTVGEIAVIQKEMAFNQSCFGIRAKREIVDCDYLYYLTQTKVRDLKNAAHGSVFDTITKESFDNIRCIIPRQLKEQRYIAEVLSSLDDKIELNRRINDNLEQQAQALFNYYFVDNVDVCDERRAMNLTKIASYVNGLAMQKFRPNENENGLPVLKIKELGQNAIDSASERCTSHINESYKVHDGDVIFSWSGTLMVKIWTGGDCGLNQHLFKVTSQEYPKWFYYFWTKHHLDKFIRIAQDKAVTMGHIKRGELEKSKVLIPDRIKLNQIDQQISPLFDKNIETAIENRTLAELRDTLLPKLMSGEVKIDKTNR